jgi:hypothetical protein
MSKWALLAAHRYLEHPAAARTIGANGRSLQRPWRIRSPRAVQQAAYERTQRRQPWWPRLLGAVCLCLSVHAGLHPEYSMPSPVGASSTDPRQRIEPIATVTPGPIHEGVPQYLAWSDAAVPPPYRLVVCDAELAPLAVFDDLSTPSHPLPAPLATELAAAGGFAWYVEGRLPTADGSGRTVRSHFEACEIR